MPDYFLLRLPMSRPLKTIITYDVRHLTKEDYFVVEKFRSVIYKMRWAIGPQGMWPGILFIVIEGYGKEILKEQRGS